MAMMTVLAPRAMAQAASLEFCLQNNMAVAAQLSARVCAEYAPMASGGGGQPCVSFATQIAAPHAEQCVQAKPGGPYIVSLLDSG